MLLLFSSKYLPNPRTANAFPSISVAWDFTDDVVMSETRVKQTTVNKKSLIVFPVFKEHQSTTVCTQRENKKQKTITIRKTP